ncbi:MAG: Gfo/Idh/MocA family oxidoreductase [Candidatus Brocadiia bacterium]
MSQIRMGVIGLGYWGPVLAKNCVTHPKTRLTAIADLNQARLDNAKPQFKDALLFTNYRDMLPHVDAVAIATPVHTHFDIGMECIRAGKHLLIEKAMTRTSDEGRALLAEAEKHKVLIAVDHLLLFQGMLRKVKQVVDSGELGEILYYYSVRANLGLFQQDVDVIWDLGPHELSQMIYLLGEPKKILQPAGSAHFPVGLIDDVFIHASYGGSLVATAYISWLSPFKSRSTVIGGTKKMLAFSDLWAGEEIKIYDRNVQASFENGVHSYKYARGGIVIPAVPVVEPLKLEIDEFASAIMEGGKLTSDGKLGLDIVEMLEQCRESLAKK